MMNKLFGYINGLKRFSTTRMSWVLLIISGVTFELIALYFQHGISLEPCILCIYQRCAIWGVVIAGIIGSISPSFFPLRLIALVLWLYSAGEGLRLAMRQVALQFHPSIFLQCEVDVNFPTWLPLDRWFPYMFKANGDCAERIWSFLSLEMSQWMVVIFAAYLVVGAIILITQLCSSQ